MLNSRFASAYYICNAFLLASYAGAKLYHAHHGKTAYSMFKEDTFASWESQCRYSLVAIALMKYIRKKSWDQYFADVFWYGKAVTAIIMFLVDLRLMAWFMLLSWIVYALLPQPELRDDSELMWLNPVKLKTDVLDPACKCSWLVSFSSPTNSDCIHTMPIIVDAANKYSSEHMKFGILDVSVFRRICHEMRIDTSFIAKELPALVLFENGKEKARMINRNPGLFPGPGIRSVKDVDKAFQLEQRSKGQKVEEPKKAKR